MNRSALLVALGVSAVVALTPALASAGNACERDRHDQKVTGTLIGALGGALLGNAVAGHGHRGDGAVVGAVGGALVGNQLSRSSQPCPDGYSYGHDSYGYERRVVEQRTYYDVPPPPPPPRYGYGYRTYYAPPPPPRAYEYRWHHHHHDDDDDDGEHDRRGY